MRVWSALIELARHQLEHLQEANPVDRFLALLRSAIATGRAHVATRDGTAPASPGAWGWCASEPASKRRRVKWFPQGTRVGWLDGEEDLFLDIDSAYQAANAMAADGDGIAVGISTLIRRLHEGGRLQSIDQRRGRLKVRRMIDGRRLEVLHLRSNFLEHPIAEKSGPIGPLTGAIRDPPDSRDLGGFALVDGVH